MLQIDAALDMLTTARGHPVARLATEVRDANPVQYRKPSDYRDEKFRKAVRELDK